MSRFRCWILFLVILTVGLAVYLNVGWTLGTYFSDYIEYADPAKMETAMDKFLCRSG